MIASSPSLENISPQVISRLQREVRQLIDQPPEGIRFVENPDDSLVEIFAEIAGPEETPYHGGVFRLKLVLSQDYPASPPRGFFLTRIFHPNVAEGTGDICVNTLKKDWGQRVTLSQIFQVIRCLLIVPFPESSLNDEAGKMFMESYDEYARRARLMTSVHAMPLTTGVEGEGDEEKKEETDQTKACMKGQSTSSSKGQAKSKSKDSKKKKKKGLKRL
mmetsp:Transcript_33105/g.43585  ORF Transcript_33105/g.43585 Transcript_33105/m.43585 type:complete len:218 (+) Transcript_33105:86-739(+)